MALAKYRPLIFMSKRQVLTFRKKTVQYTHTPNSIGALKMKQCMDAENLHRRLKKIIGQVQAIDRMVDEDVPCEDILSQLMPLNPHCINADR